jgi:isopentenyl diphosphate isomerase/L-lactate dehydrogenase-like FMN-dependent dehydrogenase
MSDDTRARRQRTSQLAREHAELRRALQQIEEVSTGHKFWGYVSRVKSIARSALERSSKAGVTHVGGKDVES